ncbi:MAG: SDR family oxidoreductase [Candidatus Heimdallarchaeota archaeon]|nr:SDR family oxidoreductase [Candidatus Heimdallarchaeota archaeon]
MDLGLNQKVALVAASSRGLGKAVAFALAKEGASIILCSRNGDQLLSVQEDIMELGVDVLAIPADLTIYTEVKHLVKEALNHFGKIDILVTNCGGPPTGGFLDFSIDDWEKAITLNLMSTIFLCKEVLPQMIQRKQGRIIMIASISVKQPIDGLILSNTVRAGVAGLAKSLSNEFGKDNVLINLVCPGYTKTERVTQLASVISTKRKISTDEVINEWASQNALNRLATPDEFANVVVFLASEKASHLTGVSVQIDGGFIKSLL